MRDHRPVVWEVGLCDIGQLQTRRSSMLKVHAPGARRMCSGIDPEVFASAGDGLTRAAESRSDTIESSRRLP